MVNSKKIISGLLVLAFFFLLFPLSASHADTVPKFMIMTEEWKPYNFQEKGTIKGISVDMLVLMLERTGSAQGRDDIQIYPWARAYKISREKPGTLLFTTARTAEREKIFKWVGPIFEIEFNIYALKSRHIRINSFEDLRKYKIGTLRADAMEELLINKTGMKVSDFDQGASNLINMKKLLAGRTDLIAQSKDTTIHTCKEAGLNPDEFEPVFILEKSSMYYAFHKETPDSVIIMFQTVFDEIKSEGKLAEIFKKYPPD